MNALDALVKQFPNRLGAVDLSAYRDDTYEPNVRNAEAYRSALLERLRQTEQVGDKSRFATDENFRFRQYEITIWTGYKGHGKSALLSQVLLGFMQAGKRVFVCSPEFHPVELLYRFLVQCIGENDPSAEEAGALMDFLAEHLWLYDVQASLKPHDVPALCRWVAEHIKPDHVVIDSLMKCGLAPDDYAGQKRLVDQVQSVAHQNPLHIHLVAHARKGQSDDRPAKLHDIKGASEIADLAENVVSVWRNKPKEQAQSMGDRTRDDEPDAMFVVEAQRNAGGWVGTTNLWYHRPAMIYYEYGRSFRSYVSIGREEYAL